MMRVLPLAGKGESSVSPVNTPRSYAWYILSIVFGLLGGVIAYFVLRKTDSKKAKICLVIGLGITVFWSAGVVSVDTSLDLFSGKTQKEKIVDQRIEDHLRAQEEKRALEEFNKNIFDPEEVASAKKDIPELQKFTKGILDQCRDIKSLEDYQKFSIVIGVMEEELIDVTLGIDIVLTDLELKGYDEHPEVGPLINQTRNLAFDTGDCLDEVFSKYGN